MSDMFKTGYIPSIPDERDFALVRLIPSSNVFPAKFEIPYKQGIKDQGQVNSCGGHSMAEEREIVEEKQSGQLVYFSPGFSYGMRLPEHWQGEGVVIKELLEVALKIGAVEYKDFPFNIEVPEIIQKVNAAKDSLTKLAADHRITGYAKLDTNNQQNKIQQIKSALTQLGPVVIGVELRESFQTMNASNCVLYWQNNPEWDASTSSWRMEQNIGGHAMVIVGWDDAITDKYGNIGAFRVINTWGTSWGDKGYCWIPYAYPIREAWSVTDNLLPVHEDPANPKYYRVQVGAFKNKAYATKLQEKLLSLGYKTVNIVLDGGYYKVQVGAYTSKPEADSLLQDLKGHKYKTIMVCY